MVGRLAIRCALALWAMVATRYAIAQEMLRLDTFSGRSSIEIRLTADEITTQTEGGSQYYRLVGGVLVEQGVVQLRANRVVARIDTGRFGRDGTYRVELYAEKDVTVENGPFRQTGDRALVILGTRARVDFRSAGGRIVPGELATDPFVQRGREALEPPGSAVVQPAQANTSPLPDVPRLDPPPLDDRADQPVLPLPSRPTTPLLDSPPGPPSSLPQLPSVPPSQQPVTVMPAAPVPQRVFQISPRNGRWFNANSIQLPTGEKAYIVTGGVVLHVSNVQQIGLVDIEADNVIIWSRANGDQMARGMQGFEGSSGRESEFYLQGNVEIRSTVPGEHRTLRADEIYYDVSRNVAVATGADLELVRSDIPSPFHLRADELLQVGPNEFRATRAEFFSSRLPSDPGLLVQVEQASIFSRRGLRRTIFGRPIRSLDTGAPVEAMDRFYDADGAVLRAGGFPIFYLPHISGNINDPLGPLDKIAVRRDGIFGWQLYTTFDLLELIGFESAPGRRWQLAVDYLSRRGPAIGTMGEYAGRNMWGLEGRYTGDFKLYGIWDHGIDILGEFRPLLPRPDTFRGRVFWQHYHELPAGFKFQGQASYLSDPNFLESYYKPEFDLERNQETFAYLTRQRENAAFSLLVKPNIRSWVTETAWLPYADGTLIGESFLDRFTYNARASAGYADLNAARGGVALPLLATDGPNRTGRFDLRQELGAPFYVGPIKVVPYGVLDLTEYTNDLTGATRGRVYGGGGAYASLPLSRLNPDMRSDLLNLNGLYHKIVLTGNYYAAWTDTPHTRLPQLDRLNDDATDQAIRNVTPVQPVINAAHGPFLATSPIFNPQLYAIRRLLDSNVDTLDKIQVFQLGIRQRYQTKRGFAGSEHTVDVMTSELSVSLFPNANRDNFGSTVGFVESGTVWNVGDRTSIETSGWWDPFTDGARVMTVGVGLNRPDRTNFYLGYRHVDPIDSRMVIASVTHVFSPKYAMTASTAYDFGISRGLSHSFQFTRSGTDLQLTMGVSYNPLINNFGLTFDVMPLIALARGASSGLMSRGPGMGGR